MHRHDSPDRRSLRCMEIWGGSHAVESEVAMPGLDAWVYSRPFEGADRGGDVHYVSLCGGGMITRTIVADVSGHGTSAGEMSVKLRDIMRKFINSKSQTGMARALNKEFSEQAKLSRFATAVIASFRAARSIDHLQRRTSAAALVSREQKRMGLPFSRGRRRRFEGIPCAELAAGRRLRVHV